jgi:hypothetical protein
VHDSSAYRVIPGTLSQKRASPCRGFPMGTSKPTSLFTFFFFFFLTQTKETSLFTLLPHFHGLLFLVFFFKTVRKTAGSTWSALQQHQRGQKISQFSYPLENKIRIPQVQAYSQLVMRILMHTTFTFFSYCTLLLPSWVSDLFKNPTRALHHGKINI